MNFHLPQTPAEAKKLWVIPMICFGLAGILFLQMLVFSLISFKSAVLESEKPKITADNATWINREDRADGGSFTLSFNQPGTATVAVKIGDYEQKFMIDVKAKAESPYSAPIINLWTGTGTPIPTPAKYPIAEKTPEPIKQSAPVIDPMAKLRTVKQRLSGYSDVTYLYKSSESIAQVTEKNIMQGSSDDAGKQKFDANGIVDRAQIATIMTRWLYQDELEQKTSKRKTTKDMLCSFEDVPKDAWYAKNVLVACQKGFMKSEDDGIFHPAQILSYADVLKIMLEGAAPWFSEIDEILETEKSLLKEGQKWYLPYVRTIKKLNILDEKLIKPLNQYPLRNTTRGWVAEVIANLEKQ